MRTHWPFSFLLLNSCVKVLAVPSPAWLIGTRSTSTFQLPHNVSRTLYDPAPHHYHVPDSHTDLVITPGDDVEQATLTMFLRVARGVVESFPSGQEASTPWSYSNAFLGIRVMIDAAPGQRISWGVIADAGAILGHGFTGSIEGPAASSQLPKSLSSPNVTRQHDIPVDVPGTRTSLILNLDGLVPLRTLDSLFQSAQGFAEFMPPEEASDNPWVYSIDLGVRVVVHTSPGARLPWRVMYNALEGLENYAVGPPVQGNFCHFRIFEGGVLVGTGVTERVPQPPDHPSASPVAPNLIGPPLGAGTAAS